MKYQKIDFGNTQIDGVDRYPDYELIFGSDGHKISNKTLLDLGCNIGFYCLRASHDGARSCVGVDNCREFIEDAKKIQGEQLCINIDFIQNDILSLDMNDKFDYIICLNTLHNLHTIENVNKVLSLCNKLSKEKVILSIIPSKHLYFIVKNDNDIFKVHLSLAYIENYFPECEIEMYESIVTPGRFIVEITK